MIPNRIQLLLSLICILLFLMLTLFTKDAICSELFTALSLMSSFNTFRLISKQI